MTLHESVKGIHGSEQDLTDRSEHRKIHYCSKVSRKLGQAAVLLRPSINREVKLLAFARLQGKAGYAHGTLDRLGGGLAIGAGDLGSSSPDLRSDSVRGLKNGCKILIRGGCPHDVVGCFGINLLRTGGLNKEKEARRVKPIYIDLSELTVSIPIELRISGAVRNVNRLCASRVNEETERFEFA